MDYVPIPRSEIESKIAKLGGIMSTARWLGVHVSVVKLWRARERLPREIIPEIDRLIAEGVTPINYRVHGRVRQDWGDDVLDPPSTE